MPDWATFERWVPQPKQCPPQPAGTHGWELQEFEGERYLPRQAGYPWQPAGPCPPLPWNLWIGWNRKTIQKSISNCETHISTAPPPPPLPSRQLWSPIVTLHCCCVKISRCTKQNTGDLSWDHLCRSGCSRLVILKQIWVISWVRYAQLSLNMALPALQQLDEKRPKNEPITPKVRGSWYFCAMRPASKNCPIVPTQITSFEWHQ